MSRTYILKTESPLSNKNSWCVCVCVCGELLRYKYLRNSRLLRGKGVLNVRESANVKKNVRGDHIKDWRHRFEFVCTRRKCVVLALPSKHRFLRVDSDFAAYPEFHPFTYIYYECH